MRMKRSLKASLRKGTRNRLTALNSLTRILTNKLLIIYVIITQTYLTYYLIN